MAEDNEASGSEPESSGWRWRAWARMSIGVALATLLAYGVVKVPRWGGGEPAPAKPVRVLVTAFEKFGGQPDNASRVMAVAFEKEWKAKPPEGLRAEVRVEVLPVTYGGAARAIRSALEEFSPDAVIAFGQASSSSYLLEMQAFNLDDSAVADNAGVVRRKKKILDDGPERHLSRLPIHTLQKALKEKGYPAVISYSAGAFLCNHVFYHLIDAVTQPGFGDRRVIAGFVHVPALPKNGELTYEQWGAQGAGAVRTVVEQVAHAAARP